MQRRDQVRVVGHLQQLQVARVVPVRRTDHHDAIRVRPANDGQRSRREHVPRLAVESSVRLVVQLEHEAVAAPLEVRRDLLPQHDEAHVQHRRGDGPLARVERVTVELPVVVHVQHDDESLRQQPVDDGVDAREKRRIDRERCLGARVIAPANRQPHRLESRRRSLVDEVVRHGEAPRAFGGRLEHVAEVHAAAEGCGGRRGAGGCTGWCVVRHRGKRGDVGAGLRRGDGGGAGSRAGTQEKRRTRQQRGAHDRRALPPHRARECCPRRCTGSARHTVHLGARTSIARRQHRTLAQPQPSARSGNTIAPT